MRRLENLNISRIAFVDKGANKKDFALFKSFEIKNDSKNHKQGDSKIMKTLREKYIQAEKVDIAKIGPGVIDEVIAALAEIKDDNAKTCAELLAALKVKLTPAPNDSAAAMDEVAAEAVKNLSEKKFSKAFIDSVKETFVSLKTLVKGIKEIKPEAEAVKKFEDENREATPEEIVAAFTK